MSSAELSRSYQSYGGTGETVRIVGVNGESVHIDADDEPGRPSPAAHACVADRQHMIVVLDKRGERLRMCRSVPVSVLLFIMVCAAFISRGRIPTAFDVESHLITTLPADLYVATYGDWFTWLTASALPQLLVQTGYDGQPIPVSGRGRFGGYDLIIGGLRLSQTRSATTSCANVDPSIQALYGGVCHPDDTTDTSTAFGNATVAAEYGVESAYTVSASGDYEFYLNVEEDYAVSEAYVNGLAASHWLDTNTKTVSLAFALLNAEVNSFGRIQFAAEFTRGGRVVTSTTVSSISINPYAGSGIFILLDITVTLYWLYLAYGCLRRLVSCLRCRQKTLYQSWVEFDFYWRALDIAVVVSLLTSMITWGIVIAKLTAIRADVAGIPAIAPSSVAGASNLQQRIFDATSVFAVFKSAGSVTIIVLALRLFKYFTFQARLAVMTRSIARGFGDAIHIGFLFGLLLAMFGIWGHFQFGSQAPDWKDISSSTTAIFKFIMYDYDLFAMEAVNKTFADFFYIFFMIGVTNLLLWMFFAVIFETYTQVRLEAHYEGPAVWDEAAAVLVSLPSQIRFTLPSFIASQRREFGLQTAEISWSAVLAAITTGPLKDHEQISAAALMQLMRVDEETAIEFVQDIARSSQSAVYYGYDLPGAPPVPGTTEDSELQLERALMQAASQSWMAASLRKRKGGLAAEIQDMPTLANLPPRATQRIVREMSMALSRRFTRMSVDLSGDLDPTATNPAASAAAATLAATGDVTAAAPSSATLAESVAALAQQVAEMRREMQLRAGAT